MNTRTARRLDALLVPLARGLARSGRPAARPAPPDAIARLTAPRERPLAAIKLVGLGSLALMAPALAAYAERTRRPTCLVTVAANRALLDLFDWRVTPVYLRSETFPHLLLDVLRQGRALRARRPAAIVDLEFHSAFTTLFGRALRPGRHVVFDSDWRRGLVTDSVAVPGDLHFAESVREVLSALAGDPLPSGEALPLRAGILPQPPARVSRRPRVVVNVNTGILCLERRLPAGVFRDLLAGLEAAVGAEFHLIGDQREAAYTDAFARLLPAGLPVTNHAGRLTLAQVLGLLADADLVISNDSGPAHLAAGLGRPVLAVFGPESPDRYGPRGRRVAVVWGRMECGPCLTVENRKTAPCRGDNRCLRQLTAEDVLPRALDLLAGRGGGVQCVGPRLPPPVRSGKR